MVEEVYSIGKLIELISKFTYLHIDMILTLSGSECTKCRGSAAAGEGQRKVKEKA